MNRRCQFSMQRLVQRFAFAGLFVQVAPSGQPQDRSPVRLAVKSVEAGELMTEVARVPKGSAQRERRVIELFHDAGAASIDFKILPIGERAAPYLDAAKKKLREGLEAAKSDPADVTAALENFDRRHAELGNTLIYKIPGKSDRVLVFGAHLDTAEPWDGVLDDWAGCVLLANLYQALHDSEPQHSIWFVLYGASEEGLLGSKTWVDSLQPTELFSIDGYVQVECAGQSEPYGWWLGSNTGMAELCVDAARRHKVPFTLLDFEGTESDAMALKNKGVPTLSLLGVEPAKLGLLHGPKDVVGAVSPLPMAQTYAVLVELARELDGHRQPLRWDYVKAKLRIDEAGSGRTSTKPQKVDLAKAAAAGAAVPALVPAVPGTPLPAPATDPKNPPDAPKKDGSDSP